MLPISGGRLWDYIESYQPAVSQPVDKRRNSLASLFSEPHDDHKSMTSVQSNPASPDGAAFLDVLEKFRSANYGRSVSTPGGVLEAIASLEQDADIPPFDVLTQNMDVIDLVNCSQRLIRSVSSTLEKVNAKEDEDDATLAPITAILRDQDVRHFDDTKSNRLLEGHCQLVHTETRRLKCVLLVPERSIKRWAAELATALQSLHAQNVYCQDLRPENLLLGAKGEIQLTFFPRSIERPLSSSAVDGLYVAPERPLTPLSDWWSFGVILFELLTGAPFVACHPGGITSYYDVQYPDSDGEAGQLVTADARDLLELLIQTDPGRRVGWTEVKQHRYFSDVQWPLH